MKSKRAIFLGFGITTFVILLLYPWKLVVVPALRVRILDEAGNPAPNAVVQEKWEYQTMGSTGHLEVSRADGNGYASFPQRTERIPLIRLVPSFAREIIYLPHGYGFGPSVTVWAFGQDPNVWYYVPLGRYEIGRGIFPEEIRLKRNEETRYPNDSKWP